MVKNLILAALLVGGAVLAGKVWQLERAARDAKAVKTIMAKAHLPRPPKSEVHGAILERTPELEICYNSYLALSPVRKEGRLKLMWEVGADGEILAVERGENEFADPRLMDCVLSKASAWKLDFPASGHPMVYVHSFSFRERAVHRLDFASEQPEE